MFNIFLCAYLLFLYPLVEMPLYVFFSFLIGLLFLLLNFDSFICIFKILILCKIQNFQYFLSLCSFHFNPLNSAFRRTKVFNKMKSNLPFFSFMNCAVAVKPKNSLPSPRSWKNSFSKAFVFSHFTMKPWYFMLIFFLFFFCIRFKTQVKFHLFWPVNVQLL